MLRFSRRPDRVFHAIMAEVLDMAIDNAMHFREGYVPREEEKQDRHEWYEAFFPRSSRLLTSDEAVELLKRLREGHVDQSTLYQLTDYHWLLLYEALDLFCDHHNDSGRKAPPIGPYRIGRLDSGDISQAFFWDLDFVTAEIKDLTPAQRDQIQVSEATWGVVQGLKPHPDELRLVPWERPGPHVPRGQPKSMRRVRYPPSGLPKWYTGAAKDDEDWGFKD